MISYGYAISFFDVTMT